jgi:hypothetical protein
VLILEEYEKLFFPELKYIMITVKIIRAYRAMFSWKTGSSARKTEKALLINNSPKLSNFSGTNMTYNHVTLEVDETWKVIYSFKAL